MQKRTDIDHAGRPLRDLARTFARRSHGQPRYGPRHLRSLRFRQRSSDPRTAHRGLHALAQDVELTKFEVNTIVGDGDVVIALCDVAFTVRATGKKVEETNEPQVWHFDARGRVRRFRHAADTAQHLAANGKSI